MSAITHTEHHYDYQAALWAARADFLIPAASGLKVAESPEGESGDETASSVLALGDAKSLLSAYAMVENLFFRANFKMNEVDRTSPIILDLDGDNNVEAGGLAYFDHANDGWAELTRWVSAAEFDDAGDHESGDGLLVRLPMGEDADDVVNGTDLFGSETGSWADGFAALKALDSDGNGCITSADSAWDELHVLLWEDANEDGVMDDGERRLKDLSDVGVTALFFNGTEIAASDSRYRDEWGNEHRLSERYGNGGAGGIMHDVWLANTPRMGRHSADIPTQSALPANAVLPAVEIRGWGRVYDLSEAMALDASAGRLAAPFYNDTPAARKDPRRLGELVDAFIKQGNGETVTNAEHSAPEAYWNSLENKILLRWSGAEGLFDSIHTDSWNPGGSNSLGAGGASGAGSTRMHFGAGDFRNTEVWKLAAVEAFEGEQWLNGVGYREPKKGEISQKVERAYVGLLEYVRGSLMLQTDDLSELYGALDVSRRTGNAPDGLDDFVLDFAPVKVKLNQMAVDNKEQLQAEFLRAIAGVWGGSDRVASNFATLLGDANEWAYSYGYYAEYLKDGVFDGGGYRQDYYTHYAGTAGKDVFQTTIPTTNPSADVDNLYGWEGNDVYHLGKGTGADKIMEGSVPGYRYYYSNRINLEARTGDGDSRDVIKIAPDVTRGEVSLKRGEGTASDNLIVLLGDDNAAGTVSHYLEIVDFYSDATPSAGVEILEGKWGSYFLPLLADSLKTAGDKKTLPDSMPANMFHVTRGMSSEGTEGGANSLDDHGDESEFYVKVSNLRSASEYDLTLQSERDSDKVELYVLAKSEISGWGHEGSIVTYGKTRYIGYTGSEDAEVESILKDDLWVDFVAYDAIWSPEQVRAHSYFRGMEPKGGKIHGTSGVDHFDANIWGDAVQKLEGGAGGDIYYLGAGTGKDQIIDTGGGDDIDQIYVKSSYGKADVSLEKDGIHLIVKTGDGNLLTIMHYERGDKFKVEEIYFEQGAADAEQGETINLKCLAGLLTEDNPEGTVAALQVELGDSSCDSSELLGGRQLSAPAPVSVLSGEAGLAALFGLVEGDLPDAQRGESSGDDYLDGDDDVVDMFDADEGGDDELYGYSGDDIYRLGNGTGEDIVLEGFLNYGDGDDGDTIVAEAGISRDDIRLSRSGDDLVVAVVGGTASGNQLTVEDYYYETAAEVERIYIWDTGAHHNIGDLAEALTAGQSFTLTELLASHSQRRGTDGVDYLDGEDGVADVFDADAGGNDELYGYSGDDTYHLGENTGLDVVFEGFLNYGDGDSGDKVLVEEGFFASSVKLRRDGDDLTVELVPAGGGAAVNRLTLKDHYSDPAAKVEFLELQRNSFQGSARYSLADIQVANLANQAHILVSAMSILQTGGGSSASPGGTSGDNPLELGSGN